MSTKMCCYNITSIKPYLYITNFDYGILQRTPDDTWHIRGYSSAGGYSKLPNLFRSDTDVQFQYMTYWEFNIPYEHLLHLQKLYYSNELTVAQKVFILY